MAFQSEEDMLHLVCICSWIQIQAGKKQWETRKNSLTQLHYGVLGCQPQASLPGKHRTQRNL